MRDYTRWVNWFRDVAPKAPAAAPAQALGAPLYDTERFRRVMRGRTSSKDVENLSRVKSFTPARRMINWLATQPADVVDAAAQYLNWNQAEDVVLWLLGQSTTDAATAVKLFMRAEPADYVRTKADNPSYEYDAYPEKVIQTFAVNWTADGYARGGVGYDPSEVTPYGSSDIFFINEFKEFTAKLSSGGVNPLPILSGLEGPFSGPKPKDIDVYLKQKGRGELFLVRFLFAGLGTWMTDEDINEADFDEWMRKNDLKKD
jgi:hypothetical protein